MKGTSQLRFMTAIVASRLASVTRPPDNYRRE
jgi:hypothetical protein